MVRKWLFAGAVVGVLMLGALPAAAHVTVSPGEASAGGYVTLTFTVPHGCDESPTTALTVEVPDGIDTATPGVNPGWTISTETEPLGDGADAEEGGERTTFVTWTAEPGNELPDHQLTTFLLSVRMPDDAGETAYFKAIQTCETGETRWISEDEDSDTPAPAVELTASTGGHGGGSADEENGDDDATAAPAAVDTSDLATTSDVNSARTVGIIGIVVGAIGIVLALVALLRKPKGAA